MYVDVLKEKPFIKMRNYVTRLRMKFILEYT